MLRLLAFSTLVTIFMSGCYGRIPSDVQGRKIDAKTYGIVAGKPALLVFGAVWCKPCMSEIPSLNRANREVQGSLQIVSFVVEGAQKGVSASPKDTGLVVSPSGDRPEYKLDTDPTWAKFDGVGAEGGRALPTMVFVSSDLTIVRIVQRSMEYETELLPALRLLVSGQKPNGPTEPEQPVGTRVTVGMADWIAQLGHDSDSAIYANVHAGWVHGLEDFNFLEEDMPFEDSKMTVLAAEDGTSQPLSAVWKAAATGCKLTVFFLSDGSYERSEGVCR